MAGWENPNLPQPLPGTGDPTASDITGTSGPGFQRDEVAYRPAESEDRSCSACVHFKAHAGQALGDGVCELVGGPISPNGVCDLFQGSQELGV